MEVAWDVGESTLSVWLAPRSSMSECTQMCSFISDNSNRILRASLYSDFRVVLFLEVMEGGEWQKARITDFQPVVWETCSPVDQVLCPGRNAELELWCPFMMSVAGPFKKERQSRWNPLCCSQPLLLLALPEAFLQSLPSPLHNVGHRSHPMFPGSQLQRETLTEPLQGSLKKLKHKRLGKPWECWHTAKPQESEDRNNFY